MHRQTCSCFLLVLGSATSGVQGFDLAAANKGMDGGASRGLIKVRKSLSHLLISLQKSILSRCKNKVWYKTLHGNDCGCW